MQIENQMNNFDDNIEGSNIHLLSAAHATVSTTRPETHQHPIGSVSSSHCLAVETGEYFFCLQSQELYRFAWVSSSLHAFVGSELVSAGKGVLLEQVVVVETQRELLGAGMMLITSPEDVGLARGCLNTDPGILIDR